LCHISSATFAAPVAGASIVVRHGSKSGGRANQPMKRTPPLVLSMTGSVTSALAFESLIGAWSPDLDTGAASNSQASRSSAPAASSPSAVRNACHALSPVRRGATAWPVGDLVALVLDDLRGRLPLAAEEPGVLCLVRIRGGRPGGAASARRRLVVRHGVLLVPLSGAVGGGALRAAGGEEESGDRDGLLHGRSGLRLRSSSAPAAG
jgi:hypothetical protein